MGRMNLSTKANTLNFLAPLLTFSRIEKYFIFTQNNWRTSSACLIEKIRKIFRGKIIIVRSSAIKEDTLKESKAGFFTSILNVDSHDRRQIKSAVEKVIASYKIKNYNYPENQILIQIQTQEVDFSGTLFTRDYDRSPYYIINYSTNDTTSITSGRENSYCVKILRNTKTEDVPIKFRKLILAIQEVEELASVNFPLDIEFAVKKNGEIIIFQVRPLVISHSLFSQDNKTYKLIVSLKKKFRNLSKPKPNLFGKTTYFTDMTDWNPAEMIGNSPNPLAYSLYDYLITDSV